MSEEKKREDTSTYSTMLRFKHGQRCASESQRPYLLRLGVHDHEERRDPQFNPSTDHTHSGVVFFFLRYIRQPVGKASKMSVVVSIFLPPFALFRRGSFASEPKRTHHMHNVTLVRGLEMVE